MRVDFARDPSQMLIIQRLEFFNYLKFAINFLAFVSKQNKYPLAEPEVLRLLAPQRGLTAIAKAKPKTKKTTNS
jgi:hypothetical protein